MYCIGKLGRGDANDKNRFSYAYSCQIVMHIPTLMDILQTYVSHAGLVIVMQKIKRNTPALISGSIRNLFYAVLACVIFFTLPVRADRWVDLSHIFNDDTIYWPTSKGFEMKKTAEGKTEKGYYYSANDFDSSEHGGTHLDAPLHFSETGYGVEQIPLSRLVGMGVVIDVSRRALKNRDYQITIKDITDWEHVYGRLPNNVILLFNTGYARFWPDREKYMGTTERGAAAVQKLHFPGLHPDAAAWLVKNRKIASIGLDTPSLDYGQSKQFETHQILAGAQIPGFENVTNLDALPPTGAMIVALPMKIGGGSGAPLRIIARVPSAGLRN